MKATIKFVEKKFEEFNKNMFGSRLPAIPVKMSDATSFLGMCVAKARTLPNGSRQHFDFELRVSLRHDLKENELEDVIIHEMIHYFIMYNELRDSSPHGEIFKAMMKSINREFNRHITISHHSTAEERSRITGEKKKWHVIAKVRMRDGHYGIKVLPRVIPKILDYHRHVGNAPEVAQIELFLHDNPFFNQFPTSAAYKIHPVAINVLTENLKGAHRLMVEDGKLIQK